MSKARCLICFWAIVALCRCLTGGNVAELRVLGADASMIVASQMVNGTIVAADVNNAAASGGGFGQRGASDGNGGTPLNDHGGSATVPPDPNGTGPSSPANPNPSPTPLPSPPMTPQPSYPAPVEDPYAGTYTFINQVVVSDNCAGQCAQITTGTVVWTVVHAVTGYVVINNGSYVTGYVSENGLTFQPPTRASPPSGCTADQSDNITLIRNGGSSTVQETFSTTLSCDGRASATCACSVMQNGSFSS